MIASWRKPKQLVFAASLLLLIFGFLWMDHLSRQAIAVTPAPTSTAAPGAGSGPSKSSQFPEGLPDAAGMQTVARKGGLELKADPITGHFAVSEPSSGKLWTSYPQPDQWEQETVQSVWRNNLKSPLMYDTIDLSKSGETVRSANIIDDFGEVIDYAKVEDGFRVTFNIRNKELLIPVEVKLGEDFVETRIVDAGLKEGKHSLVRLRLYPFLGSSQSAGQDGFLLIPDGTGALIRFKDDRASSPYLYHERVFGADLPFARTASQGSTAGRMTVNHPIFGIKAGDQGVLAIIRDGAEYAEIIAAPSGMYSQYNFASVQQLYRESFFQPTTAVRQANKEPQGFTSYNQQRFGTDRVTRYSLLSGEDSDYTGMAIRYREYLMQEVGLQPIASAHDHIPFFLSFVGGDFEKGFLVDRYVTATTTKQAEGIIDDLRARGIDNQSITWLGWQNGGLSGEGGLFPVHKRLGGNIGMKAFIDHAHSLGFPVYMSASYARNNTGGDGFSARNHGLADLSGKVLTYSNRLTGKDEAFVSPRWMQQVIEGDLAAYQKLGTDGLSYHSIGMLLSSDYNPKYTINRSEALHMHTDILRSTAGELGGVQADSIHAFAIPYVHHINDMAMDYSYDLFTDEAVPFVPMALHGLVTYTASPINNSVQYKEELLRRVEYGAYPSFVFTQADAKALKQTYGASAYWNTSYSDWADIAVREYNRINDALADVQSVLMTGHRTLAPKVKETTYASGHKTIVNYNTADYREGSLLVPALDFVVIQGGGTSDANADAQK